MNIDWLAYNPRYESLYFAEDENDVIDDALNGTCFKNMAEDFVHALHR